MPFTLWISILITIGLVFLTYLGGKVHLNNNEQKDTSFNAEDAPCKEDLKK